MKIGIDVSTVLNHGQDIGAGRYIINLLKGLFEIDKEDTFILTGRYITDEYLPVINTLKSDFYKNKIKLKLYKTTQKKLNLWNRLRFPPIELLGFNADILHCPDFLIPPTLNKNIVLTIHDLSFIRFPQFNFSWFIEKYSKEVKKNAKLAKKILADSQSTKDDIVNFFKINPNKVEVTYLSADSFFKKLPSREVRKEILKKYKIDKKYILSVGTIEPRKNFTALIKAFSIARAENPNFNYKLVIVGRTGWKSEATYKERDMSQYKKDILFLGRVSDEDLLQIYNQAELFVFPSIFEGFGLPALEAMSCGLPIIASNCASLKEIVGSAGIFVSPTNIKQMQKHILAIVKDKNLKEELGEKSLAQAKKFTWVKTAQKTLGEYKYINPYTITSHT